MRKQENDINQFVHKKFDGEKLNSWTLNEYIRTFINIGLKIPLWMIQHFCFFIPLKQNRVIFYALKQQGYSGNLKYLYRYIQEAKIKDFEIVWIVKTPQSFQSLKEKGIPVMYAHSFKHFVYRHRSQFIFTDDEFYPPCIKRRNQIFINVWHGGINYKKIGYLGLKFTNSLQRHLYKMLNPQPDFFISGSRSFTETTSLAFDFPKSIFLPYGLPRNDVLLEVHPQFKEILCEKLGISKSYKLVLYAPTFRKGLEAPNVIIDWNSIQSALEKRFGGEWIVLIRQHYFVHDNSLKENSSIIDVSDYEDMQELLGACECLISDYSSCMWDYSMTEKPCFVYGHDLVEYQNEDRSLFIPVTEWPYPICRTIDELCSKIMNFDESDYKNKIRKHQINMGSFENRKSCKKLTDKMLEIRRNL